MKDIIDLKIEILVDYFGFIGAYLVEMIDTYNFFYLGLYYRVYTLEEHNCIKRNKDHISLKKKFFGDDVIVKLYYKDTVKYKDHTFIIYSQKV